MRNRWAHRWWPALADRLAVRSGSSSTSVAWPFLGCINPGERGLDLRFIQRSQADAGRSVGEDRSQAVLHVAVGFLTCKATDRFEAAGVGPSRSPRATSWSARLWSLCRGSRPGRRRPGQPWTIKPF